MARRRLRRVAPVTLLALVVLLAGAGPAAADPPVSTGAGWWTKLRPQSWPANPGGAAVSPDGGILWVSIPAWHVVVGYATADGTYLTTLGYGQGAMKNPQGVATDQFGDVYVADAGDGRILRFHDDGFFVKAWSSPGAQQVASDGFSLFVLAPFLNVVSHRSRDGADLGAFVASFTSFVSTPWYDLPTMRATALAADHSTHAIVAGQFAQNRNSTPRKCAISAITNKGPQELPDPLKGPGIGIYAAGGAPVGQSHAVDVGAPCWASPYSRESYDSSDTFQSGRALAADPVTGAIAAAPDDAGTPGQAFFVRWLATRQDGTPYADGASGLPKQVGFPINASYTPNGEIRQLAFDCRANLWVLTDAWLFRFRNTSGPAPDCIKLDERVILGEATFGPATKPGAQGKRAHVRIPLECPPRGTSCSGVVDVVLRPKVPCPTCDLRLKARFRVAAGRTKTLSLSLDPRTAKALGAGATVALRATAQGAREAARRPVARLREAASITLRCGPGGAVTGTAPPGAQLLLGAGNGTTSVRAGKDGRFSAVSGAVPQGGVITVAFSGGPRMAPAGAACLRRDGTPPPALTAPGPGTEAGPPGGEAPLPAVPGLATSMLTAACARRPADLGLTASGTLTPAVAGSVVKVVFTPDDVAVGPPVTLTIPTDAAGAWQAEVAPPAPGTWTVAASFAGDAGRTAATASSCSVAATP